MSPEELRVEIVRIVDGACWLARQFGHDDHGLEYPVDIDGNALEPLTGEESYHPSAVVAANKIMELRE